MLRAKKTRGGKLARLAVLSGALTAATALTVGAAAPSPDLVAEQEQARLSEAVNVQLASIASALADVVRAYAEGKPPTEFPEELTALVPGLDRIGPQLLAALGSDENTAFIQGLSLVNLLNQLGVVLPDGIDLPIPDLDFLDLDLSDLGLNIITTGPPFFALNTLGLDLGSYIPAFPNQIANDINDTEYTSIDLADVPNPSLLLVADRFTKPPYNLNAAKALRAATEYCKANRCGPNTFSAGIPNLRLPFVLGWGPGALATGMAWDQVVADLPNQPGGTGVDAEDGRSLTLLTTILLRNWGRSNGGVAARFAPFFKLIGIDTVTPDFGVEQDGDATLVPIKVDATVEYDPFSDFAAWANPFTLANNAAAGVFPTYLLRSGVDPLGMLGSVIEPVLPALLGNVALGVLDSLPDDLQTELVPLLKVPCLGAGPACLVPLLAGFNVNNAGPFTIDVQQSAAGLIEQFLGVDIPDGYFATNEYLTFRQDALPLLEPARLPVDLINVVFGTNLSNPFADASEEALTSLVALGYTDVVRNADGTYTRTLDEAGLGANTGGVPFGTLPDNIDWRLVPADVLASLLRGFEKEFLDGEIPGVNDPADPQRNAIAALANLLGLGGLIDGGLINNLPELSESANVLSLPAPTALTNSAQQRVTFTPEASRSFVGGELETQNPPTQEVSKTTSELRPEDKALIESVPADARAERREALANKGDQAKKSVAAAADRVKGAVSDAHDQVRKAVDKTVDTVKKAVTPKKKEKATESAE